ncbi:MAG: L-lactate dehydrogenase [Eubacteriales bacterium]|nr:L-lactate dehydrogenase [Eubacteriales bacterium]
MSIRKVAIIGAGHVGSHCASALAFLRAADVITLVDRDGGKAKAQAMDAADSVSFLPYSVTIKSGEYSDCADADITVIAVGKPRLPGQTRLDLLDDSVHMARDAAACLKESGFDGIVISITNPADIIADCIRKELQKERWQAFSTGTLLDTARLIRILSELTGCGHEKIHAFALGEHGDSSMIPFSDITIDGVPFDDIKGISRERVLERTHGIGMDIINGKGSTEFGIGLALATMVKAIFDDEKRIMPASVLLEGEYGQKSVHCGVPCVIGRSGIEKIIELPLTPEEKEQLNQSCDIIRQYINRADKLPHIKN